MTTSETHDTTTAAGGGGDHPVAGDSAGPLYWLFRDTWSVTKRNLRHYVRQPRLLVFSTIQPVMFVLLFSFVFDGVVGEALPGGVSYIDFLLPGILIHSSAFRTTQTAVGLAEDLERAIGIDLNRSTTPRSRSSASPTAVWVVRNAEEWIRMPGSRKSM